MILAAKLVACALASLSWGYDDLLPEETETGSLLPAYVSLSPNINDYDRFADGGPDANWYIGFNNAWIVKLPPAPVGDYKKAFIGAKLGRAKTTPRPNKPWLRRLINGKVYMAISQRPAFSSRRSYFLVETADVPRQPDPQTHVGGVGASEWFWAEVPLSQVSFSKPNYLVIYSPTRSFTSAETAPILAAAAIESRIAGSVPRAWNNRSISGVPPRRARKSLETPINNIYPALAIKLAPASSAEVYLNDFTVRAGRLNRHYVEFSVGGENVAGAWVEMSRDQLDWERISEIRRKPPYIFTIRKSRYPAPGNYLRAAARDISGNLGASVLFPIPFPPRPPVKPAEMAPPEQDP